jgi:hypothetical protein
LGAFNYDGVRRHALAAIAAGVVLVFPALTARGQPASYQGNKIWEAYKLLAAEYAMELHPKDKKKGIAYCQQRLNRLLTTCSVADLPPPGATPRLPDHAVQEALDLLKQLQPYTQQQFFEHPDIKAMCEEYTVTPTTIWARMHEAEPGLCKRFLVEFKQPLTPAQQDARIEAAVRWLKDGINPKANGVVTVNFDTGDNEHSRRYYNVPTLSTAVKVTPHHLTTRARCTIYLDAKHTFIQPEDEKKWDVLEPGQPRRTQLHRDPRMGKKPDCLYYYTAVCYKYGCLGVVFVTGTRGFGYRPDKTYKVSAGWPGEYVMHGSPRAHGILPDRDRARATVLAHAPGSPQCSRTTW